MRRVESILRTYSRNWNQYVNCHTVIVCREYSYFLLQFYLFFHWILSSFQIFTFSTFCYSIEPSKIWYKPKCIEMYMSEIENALLVRSTERNSG